MKNTLQAPKSERFEQEYSASVTNGSSVALATIPVPAGCRLRLISGMPSVGTAAAVGSVYFAFLFDGFPKPPYDAIYDVIGTVRMPLRPLTIDGGGSLVIMAYNNYSAPVKMGYNLEWELEYL